MDPQPFDILAYAAVLRRQWVTIALVLIGTLGASVYVTSQQMPLYASTSRLVIESFNQSAEIRIDDLLGGSSEIETTRIRLLSQPVRERVDAQVDALDDPTTWSDIDVDIVPNTHALDITITSTDRDDAARVANLWANEFLDWRRQEASDDFLAAQTDLDRRSQDIRDQLAQLPDDATEDTDEQAATRNSLTSQLAQLTSQRIALGDATQALRGGGSILEDATPNPDPIAPKPIRNTALAAVLGLTLGVGLALLRDHLDDEIKDGADVRRLAGDIPILGALPHWADDQNQVVSLVRRDSQEAESFRTLTTSIKFLLAARDHNETATNSVLVTSAGASEGKTSLAVNVAVAAARAGVRTILVDADLRRPNVATMFGLPTDTGLTTVLANADVQLRDVLVFDVGIPDLRVLPAGQRPPNPSELLASQRMQQVLALLDDVAELVIIDSPPAGLVSDALQLAPHVDNTIQVVRLEVSHRRKVIDTIEKLALVGARPAGLVINDLTSDRSRYYGYYYAPEEAGTNGGQPGDRGTRRRSSTRKRSRRVSDDPVEAAPAADLSTGDAPWAHGDDSRASASAHALTPSALKGSSRASRLDRGEDVGVAEPGRQPVASDQPVDDTTEVRPDDEPLFKD